MSKHTSGAKEALGCDSCGEQVKATRCVFLDETGASQNEWAYICDDCLAIGGSLPTLSGWSPIAKAEGRK